MLLSVRFSPRIYSQIFFLRDRNDARKSSYNLLRSTGSYYIYIACCQFVLVHTFKDLCYIVQVMYCLQRNDIQEGNRCRMIYALAGILVGDILQYIWVTVGFVWLLYCMYGQEYGFCLATHYCKQSLNDSWNSQHYLHFFTL